MPIVCEMFDAPTRWLVTSEQDSTVVYLVDLGTGECSCPSYSMVIGPENRRTGKHLGCKHNFYARNKLGRILVDELIKQTRLQTKGEE